MKKICGLIGMGLYWVLWPVWYVYFKLWPLRSRVLVVADGEILLVKGWLSDGTFGLPGGGKSRSETILQSAVRELNEETGIDVPESALKQLGKRRFVRNGLAYQVVCYALELDSKPELHVRHSEIIDAVWVPTESGGDSADQDTRYALGRYMPASQETLL